MGALMASVLRTAACLWPMLATACGSAEEHATEQPPAGLEAPAEENSVDSIRVPPAPLRYAVLAPVPKAKMGGQQPAARR